MNPQAATIADILATAPAYADKLRAMKLDTRDETIRRTRESLYACLAYLLAVDADGKLATRRPRKIRPTPKA